MSPLDRFASKVVVSATGCHLWQAGRHVDGYGLFFLEGRTELAHRAAWRLLVGPIPAGLHVLHRCDAPGCVNVEHLKLGTNADNVADREAAGHGRLPPPRPARPRKRCALCSKVLGNNAWSRGAVHCVGCRALGETPEARRARCRAWSEAGLRARASRKREGEDVPDSVRKPPGFARAFKIELCSRNALLVTAAGNGAASTPVTR